jgi:predicted RNase H-related nuclease YkuK (DUF458 family)
MTKKNDKIRFHNAKKQMIDNEVEYILQYIQDEPGSPVKSSPYKIALGCDSKSNDGKATYSITIVFYNEEFPHGAHIVSKTVKIPKFLVAQGYIASQWFREPFKEGKAKRINEGDNGVIFNRLFNEAQYLLELGLYLDGKLQGKYYKKHEPNTYDGSIPYRLPEIHIDFNPDEGEKGQNKSNSVYQATMGMLCGYGFKVVGKPDAWASSSAADAVAKKKI